jgi:DNA helicase II / ATP-dependent DNA helicase PcrA
LEDGAGEESFYDPLVLSTIHQAKGLEWKAVFLIGLCEGQFPHAKSLADEDALEEERRLFYVAVTRAKEELFLMHPMTRFDYAEGMVICRPSLFVEELPSDTYQEVEVDEEGEEPTIYLD